MAGLMWILWCMAIYGRFTQGLVLQTPAVISQRIANDSESAGGTVLEQYPCIAPSNTKTSTSGVAVSIIPETPPANLFVEFQYITGGPNINKLNLWTAIAVTMARVAINNWNLEMDGQSVFRFPPNIEIVVISSVNPPRYQVKSILWTLQRAFDVYNEEGLYTSSLLRTRLDEGGNEQYLGFARIKITTEPSVTEPQMNLSTSRLGDGTSLVTTSTSHESLVPGTPFSPIAADGQNDMNLQARGFQMALVYTRGGTAFRPQGFYNTILTTLVWAAQHDPKSQASGLMSSYNRVDNYTLAISPTSTASRDNLPWERVIQILGMLPGEMLAQERGGKWAELQGRVKYNNAYIGRIRIAKGELQNQLQNLDEDDTAAAGDQGVDPCNYFEYT